MYRPWTPVTRAARFSGAFCGLLWLLGATARAQAPAPSPDAKVVAELRALYEDASAARQRRDRAALERIYAPEFVWVHASGFVDDRAATFEDWFSADSTGAIPIPSFAPPTQLLMLANGQVAVLRARMQSRAAGALWSSTIHEKGTDGQWRIVQIAGTTLLPEHPVTTVPAATLDSLVGRYARGGGVHTRVERRGDQLVLRHPGIPARVLVPAADTLFYDKLGTAYTFGRDSAGARTFRLRMPNGREGAGTRVP